MITESFYTRYYHSEGTESRSEGALSVLLSPRSFQFAVFDRSWSKVSELCHIELPAGAGSGSATDDHVQFLLNNYGLQGVPFSEVRVALLHSNFVLMPPAFSEQTDLREVLDFAGGPASAVNSAKHRVGDIDLCFSTSHSLVQELEKSFSNARLRHAGAVSISLLMNHHSLRSCNVLLTIHDGMIELALRDGLKLLMYNVYAVAGKDDILYYLLFMAEQFEIKPSAIVLGLAGTLPADNELLTHLRRFTGTVNFVTNAPSVLMKGRLASVPSHFYFSLLNQHLCEL